MREAQHQLARDEYSQGGYFPLQYYLGFLDYIRSAGNIEVITYDDLAWDSGPRDRSFFEREHRNWQQLLARGVRSSKRIYLLIQHDVDSRPERSMRVLKEEADRGIKSNTMIFAQRHDRQHLKNHGAIQYTDYELDYRFMKELETERGFVFGYHCNAYEQALYDLAQAQKRMDDDILRLREQFVIRYWSAHGGVPAPTGENNKNIVPSNFALRETIWVHNGSTPVFDGNYSDGGLNNRKSDPNKRDLRDFVARWETGKRYRVLTHPQYYHSPPHRNEWLLTARWYKELLDTYQAGDSWTKAS